jgi:hypothetical protein
VSGSGGLREDSVAVTHLVQPVRAEALRGGWGKLTDALLAQILVGIAWSIGLVGRRRIGEGG